MGWGDRWVALPLFLSAIIIRSIILHLLRLIALEGEIDGGGICSNSFNQINPNIDCGFCLRIGVILSFS